MGGGILAGKVSENHLDFGQCPVGQASPGNGGAVVIRRSLGKREIDQAVGLEIRVQHDIEEPALARVDNDAALPQSIVNVLVMDALRKSVRAQYAR